MYYLRMAIFSMLYYADDLKTFLFVSSFADCERLYLFVCTLLNLTLPGRICQMVFHQFSKHLSR